MDIYLLRLLPFSAYGGVLLHPVQHNMHAEVMYNTANGEPPLDFAKRLCDASRRAQFPLLMEV
jgi:hypothetical protein